ncbi:hypothetical protein [Saccharothrix syringae]|uniref:Uncharacterized protein n=1 Tax=Saccharothrix syringae TaxID=103733 RepID=A0A5Q0H409_SACSY|nr:hypothetical protein [Saccharothrix syringae]QFZ20997.1 hypothetical protein EKG83_29660 [Saccharothrix syringae]
MRSSDLRIPAALVAAVALVSGCGISTIVTVGQASDNLKDVPVIERVPNICRVLAEQVPQVVGPRPPGPAPAEESLGSHTCRWPAATTPLGAEVVVDVAVDDRPAEATARTRFHDFVDQRRNAEAGRVFGLIPYGDNQACVQAWNTADLQYLGVMKEANVTTTVSIQTRDTAAPGDLAGLAADVNGPLRTVLRAVDAAVNRAPMVFKDPSGDLPRKLSPEEREVAPEWDAYVCRDELAPPVF